MSFTSNLHQIWTFYYSRFFRFTKLVFFFLSKLDDFLLKFGVHVFVLLFFLALGCGDGGRLGLGVAMPPNFLKKKKKINIYIGTNFVL